MVARFRKFLKEEYRPNIPPILQNLLDEELKKVDILRKDDLQELFNSFYEDLTPEESIFLKLTIIPIGGANSPNFKP